MSVQSINEQNYWKAYCQIIKSALAPQLGPNAALFYCTETVRCIPAADWIPPEVTNLNLFFLADSLLDPTNLFFVPNRSDGYIKSLQTYLSWVDIGGNPDLGVRARYKDAQTNLSNAAEGKRNALTSALADWAQETKAGLTTSDFPSWASQNAPQYTTAVKTYNGMAGQAKSDSLAMNGELAPQYSQDQDKIDSALYSQVPISGITMSVSNADLSSFDSQFAQALKGVPQTLTPATGIYQKGAYSLQGYAETMKNWYSKFSDFKKNPQSKPISLSSGSQLALSDFGITNTSGVAGFDWAPFISFGANFNSSEKRESMSIDNKNYQIDMKLTYGDMQTFTINPGNWSIGNPKSTYPNLRDGAPDQVKNLVRPVQILCGTAIGLDITFSGGAETAFDSMYSKYQTSNGGLRIFGFDIGIEGTQSSSDTSTTHTGKWDRNGGHFVVQPVDSAGWCTLLGVLGEKLH